MLILETPSNKVVCEQLLNKTIAIMKQILHAFLINVASVSSLYTENSLNLLWTMMEAIS